MDDLPPSLPHAAVSMLGALSAYDLPRVEALVRYFHASAGFPVKLTWFADIKEGKNSTPYGLTYTTVAKY